MIILIMTTQKKQKNFNCILIINYNELKLFDY